MKKTKFFAIIVSALSLVSCSIPHEVVMPYKNLGGYDGTRLFPIKTNESEFTFRAWISNSTSIDRIISISKDSLNYRGTLIEMGKMHKGKKQINYYHEIAAEPLSGFESFRNRLDRLKVQTLISQPCCIEVPYDLPISTYVIELKSKYAYNCFKFETNYPSINNTKDIYTDIEKLLFDEFELKKYFKFEHNIVD